MTAHDERASAVGRIVATLPSISVSSLSEIAELLERAVASGATPYLFSAAEKAWAIPGRFSTAGRGKPA